MAEQEDQGARGEGGEAAGEGEEAGGEEEERDGGGRHGAACVQAEQPRAGEAQEV
jgi:hypothetical protein